MVLIDLAETKSMFKGFLVLFMILFGGSAWGFDRLLCDSTLRGWTVHNQSQPGRPQLSKKNASAEFKRKESKILVVRDQSKKEIAAISPWNGVSLIKGKTAQSKGYKFIFNSNETGFSLEVREPKSKVQQKVACRFTF